MAAQAAAEAAASAEDMLILTVRANGVERGEYTLLRQPDGDFWVAAEDLPRLQVAPVETARRRAGGQDWFSLRALGAGTLRFVEAELALHLDFPAEGLRGSRIDLGGRPPAVPVQVPRASLILSYRLATRSSTAGNRETLLDNDWNVRVGNLLLRQETKIQSGGLGRTFQRGRTQLIHDDQKNARRTVAGDVISSAGSFGTAITGAGVLVTKLYDLAPDIIRQPTASLRASTTLPAQVEVSVDGNTIHRSTVPPGPISVDNLLLYGGSRTIRVTVVDAAGRREVYEQPFLFTDTVLAEGLHEYSYFAGRRSELDGDGTWRYREAAFQGYHRYGVNDFVTVSAGGEGSRDFVNGGAGVALRSDRLGLLSLELLGSRDLHRAKLARGWAARYTYLAPNASLVLAHRQFDEGFRTFGTTATSPFLRNESRIGVSANLFKTTTLSADLVRSVDARQKRLTAAVRLSAGFWGGTSVSAELQASRTDTGRDWGAYLFVRKDLDGRNWVGTTVRSTSSGRGVDLDAGRRVEGEGLGYRLGVSTNSQDGRDTAYSFLSADWNLRPATLEFYGSQPVQGGGSRFTEFGISGALVAIDGSWGLTRRVDDSFVLARLGVPQEGVEVALNNQVQGKTNAAGELFLPQVGAFGRQDVSVNDKQVGLQYNLAVRRQTITPAYRSGLVANFGGKKQNAVAGMAWRSSGGQRLPIASQVWSLRGPAGALEVQTSAGGDFYLEDAAPGNYGGTVDVLGTTYACQVTIPAFDEPVHELTDGILCK